MPQHAAAQWNFDGLVLLIGSCYTSSFDRVFLSLCLLMATTEPTHEGASQPKTDTETNKNKERLPAKSTTINHHSI